MKNETAKDDVWLPSVCQNCLNYCGIRVHRVNGVVVKIDGDPDSPRSKGKLCVKGQAGIMDLYSPHRLKTPLKRTNPEKGIGIDPQWQEISWEEALNTVAEKLRKIRQEDPRKLVIMSFDNDFQAHFKGGYGAAFGTPLTLSGAAAYFCGPALHQMAFLTQGAFMTLPDLGYCNYLILIGSQTGFGVGLASTKEAIEMADARMRGMRLVVIDPIMTTAAAKADEWLPIRPGTDAALALAMLNVLLNEAGVYDAEFIKKCTNGPYLVGPDGYYLRDKATNKPLIWDPTAGKAKTYDSPDIKDFALEGNYKINGVTGKPAFQQLKEHVRQYTCEEVAGITTIPAETIRRIAREFGEAARIGSKIVIEGKELPYRPACILAQKGPNSQSHAMLTVLAIQLINMIVGNIDVPGGSVGTSPVLLPNSNSDFSWTLTEDADGMLVSGETSQGTPGLMREWPGPYPARQVKRPERVDLFELFPVAGHSPSLSPLVLLNPEKFKIPYTPEVLLHCRTNIMATTLNPVQVGESLKKFSFMFSFAFYLDETAEFADIVLPDAHYLEKLDPQLAVTASATGSGPGDWYYPLRQPVVSPPPQVRPWQEVLLEIADRAGFLKDLYHMFNIVHRLKEPYTLDVTKKYSWEEIVDRLSKSWFGPEHGLAWFKEHGSLKWPKKVEEAYPRVFIKARSPIYFEHFIKAGEAVKRVTEEMGIDWDVSDYQALPDWKPCPAYAVKSPEYDLYAVNYKIQFHNLSVTANNVWLNELGEYHPSAYYLLINGQTAQEKGLKDEDLVCLQTETGEQVKGRVKVTPGIHPEVVGIGGCFGHWAARKPIAKGKGVHFNTLLPISLERIDMLSAAVDFSVKVKVTKVG